MDEITLFNINGIPVAYISPDEDFSIYLWSGKPVAYLSDKNIYGFNGKHLGWFEEGIIWTHNGERIGFLKSTLPVNACYEPYKSYKQYKPYKNYKEYAPYRPHKSNSISVTPLEILLNRGN
jgi:hypothetical protein